MPLRRKLTAFIKFYTPKRVKTMEVYLWEKQQ